MGVNVKLGNDTISGVDKVKLVDATDTSTYDAFQYRGGFDTKLNSFINFVAEVQA